MLAQLGLADKPEAGAAAKDTFGGRGDDTRSRLDGFVFEQPDSFGESAVTQPKGPLDDARLPVDIAQS